MHLLLLFIFGDANHRNHLDGATSIAGVVAERANDTVHTMVASGAEQGRFSRSMLLLVPLSSNS